MSKHTPGPWAFYWLDREQLRVHQAPHIGVGVAGCYSEANARLIAAAPELLELLQEIVDRGLSMTRIAKARDVIAKATGGQP